MISTSENEEFVYAAVANGCLEIRADGTIWRVAYEKSNRWNSDISFRSCEPKQLAEKAPPTALYLTVKVMRLGKQVSVGVHRLVYRHFYGPIPPGLTINHKNGVTTDNRPENLELATYSEQVKHAIQVLGRKPKDQEGTKNDMAKLTEAAVREIRRRRKAGESLKSIAGDFGVTDRQVSRIALGRRWAFLG